MTTRTAQIIDEISQLQWDELEEVLKEIHLRIDQQKQVETILDEYMGIGAGFWQTDAQEYVSGLRSEENHLTA